MMVVEILAGIIFGSMALFADGLHMASHALALGINVFAYFGLTWMDPFMGIVGAILVSRWSLGLLKASSSVLLDTQGPERIQREIVIALKAMATAG